MTGRRQYRHPERSSALHLLLVVCARRGTQPKDLSSRHSLGAMLPIRDHRRRLGLCGVPRNAGRVYPKSLRDRIALEGWHGMTHLQRRRADPGMACPREGCQRKGITRL